MKTHLPVKEAAPAVLPLRRRGRSRPAVLVRFAGSGEDGAFYRALAKLLTESQPAAATNKVNSESV